MLQTFYINLMQAVKTSSLGESGSGASANEIKLNYQYSLHTPADLSVEGMKNERLTRLPKSSVNIKEIFPFEGVGTVVVYTKSEQDSQPYFGIEIAGDPSAAAGDLFEFGPGYLKDAMLVKSQTFGKPHLRLTGLGGPSAVWTCWVTFIDDVPVADFRLDTRVYKADLDGDGMSEVFAIKPDPLGDVYIYKNIGGRIEYVDLHKELHVGYMDSVAYLPESSLFQVSSDGTIVYYRCAPGNKLLRVAG